MVLKERIQRIQRKLGVEPDGIIGSDTVSALERTLGIVPASGAPTESPPILVKALTLSRKGIDQLVADEICSEAYYAHHLSSPTWPGGASGVTIGIGYDLGYRTRASITRDWGPHLSEQTVKHLRSASGIRGQDAKGVARCLKQAGVRVPLEPAKHVFWAVTLPELSGLTREVYPGTENLPPDAQAALLSLIYNRGGGFTGPRRVEMANIADHVRRQDLEAIARELESMKRLWVSQGLEGLLKRREREASLVRGSVRAYRTDELIYA
jgi:hypothetical protein